MYHTCLVTVSIYTPDTCANQIRGENILLSIAIHVTVRVHGLSQQSQAIRRFTLLAVLSAILAKLSSLVNYQLAVGNICELVL